MKTTGVRNKLATSYLEVVDILISLPQGTIIIVSENLLFGMKSKCTNL